MLRHVVVSPVLTLFEVPIDSPTQPEKAKPGRNNIFIIDRSGSMSCEIAAVVDDVLREVRALPADDFVSVGWFSGVGEYRFPIRNHRITETASDLAPLVTTINGLRSTVGMTCFSEVLADLETVIAESAAFGSSYTLTFLTDGRPTVGDPQRELQRVYAAIDRIKGKIDSALLVAYGDYCDKQLMADMAERIGGSLVHADNVASFSASLSGFLKDTADSAGRVVVELPLKVDESDIVFSLAGKSVVTYLAVGGKSVEYNVRRAGGNRLFILTQGKTVPAGSKAVSLAGLADLNKEANGSLVRGLYAAAFALAQRLRNDLAIDVLGLLGEKALVDSVSASFTPADCGKAEASLVKAMYFPKERHRAGFVPGCVPREDAFSVLDALDLLENDEEARFYPFHADFEYKRVGAKTTPREGYPEFTPDKSGCALSGLTWNSARLNLSIGVQIRGTVSLLGDYASHGFAARYPSVVTRNYTIIRDGNLNVTKLPMSLCSESFAKLQAEGVIDARMVYAAGAIYTLDLSAIPLVNRAIAKGKTSAKELCSDAIEELRLEARIKTFKWAKAQLDPDGSKLRGQTTLTPAQEAYLESQGIKPYGFSPPIDQAEPTDVYSAKSFELKIAGFSSLPKIEDVQEKLTALDEAKKNGAKGKKPRDLTRSQALIAEALAVYDQDKKRSGTKALLALVDSRIKSAQADLRAVRSKIQRTKFAVLLGNSWFVEIPRQDESTFEHADHKFTFQFRELTVQV